MYTMLERRPRVGQAWRWHDGDAGGGGVALITGYSYTSPRFPYTLCSAEAGRGSSTRYPGTRTHTLTRREKAVEGARAPLGLMALFRRDFLIRVLVLYSIAPDLRSYSTVKYYISLLVCAYINILYAN